MLESVWHNFDFFQWGNGSNDGSNDGGNNQDVTDKLILHGIPPSPNKPSTPPSSPSYGNNLPKRYAHIIWYFSFVCLVSAFYAIYQRHYDLSLVPGTVFLSSLLYWSEPVYGWRMKLDIFAVCLGATYQMIRSWQAEKRHLFLAIFALGCASFMTSVYFQRRHQYKLSTLFHLGCHACGNLSNIVLYSGYVPPLFQP